MELLTAAAPVTHRPQLGDGYAENVLARCNMGRQSQIVG